jgi:hypothetical protein
MYSPSTMPVHSPDATSSSPSFKKRQYDATSAPIGGISSSSSSSAAGLLERESGWEVLQNFNIMMERGKYDVSKRFVDYVAGRLFIDPKTLYLHSDAGLWKLTSQPQNRNTEEQRKRILVDDTIIRGLDELPTVLGKTMPKAQLPGVEPDTGRILDDEAPDAVRFIANAEYLAQHLTDDSLGRASRNHKSDFTRNINEREQCATPWAFMTSFCAAKLTTGMITSWNTYLTSWGIGRYSQYTYDYMLKHDQGWMIWADITYLCVKDMNFSSSGRIYSKIAHDSYMIEKARVLEQARAQFWKLIVNPGW